MELAGNILGGIGVICFLTAYFLLQKGAISANGIHYLGMNLAGAVLVMLSLLVDWNLSAFVLEAAWAGISLYGIYRHLYKKIN